MGSVREKANIPGQMDVTMMVITKTICGMAMVP